MVWSPSIHGIAPMLTDAKIKAAKPRDKAYKLSDSGQLYLYVSTTGSRTWRLNYTFGKGSSGTPKQKTLTLGAYPAMTLSMARTSRDEAKAMLRDGKDPAVERKIAKVAASEKHINTFEIVARTWWGKMKPRWSAVHAADVISSLEKNIFDEIGALPIAAIKTPKLLSVLSKVEARGAIETAHRLRSRLSSVFVFALGSGLVESDPAASLGKALSPIPKAKPQPAVTTLPALQQVLIDCEAERCRATTKLALRLIALTAVRPGELRHARWQEFEDLDGPEPLWRIPAERMKGDENRKSEVEGDHLVPLSKQAVETLNVLHRLSGDLDLVFPSERNPLRPISENTLRALLIRAGYHQRHVPHGFRAAFSTIMNERANVMWRDAGHKDVSPDRAIIDLMLAHLPHGMSGSENQYNRAAYMPRRRELAQEWADLLLRGFWPPEIHLGQPIRFAARGTGRQQFF